MVRNMKFNLPLIPNVLHDTPTAITDYGVMNLRLNKKIGLIENASFISSSIAYTENYDNNQAYSDVFTKHLYIVLALLKSIFPQDAVLVEVGCGKGDFVELIETDKYFSITGFDTTYTGFNKNIKKKYLDENDSLTCDVLILRHILEHVSKPHKFLAMLQKISPNATIYIEVPNYDWIIERGAFYDITYEHVNYFSSNALQSLFNGKIIKHGFLFENQYQYIIANLSSLSEQYEFHYNNQKQFRYLNFTSIFPNIKKTIEKIEALIQNNNRLYIWGAGTKGCLFLFQCYNMKKLIDKVGFAIDINPNKIGKYLQGSLVSVRHKNEFFKVVKPNDVLLICNPIYQEEIISDLSLNDISDIRILTL